MIQFATEPGGPEAFDAFAFSLLQADWESATGPMRFSPSLTLSDLADAAFFQNTRLFLAALAAEQGTPATATGNLTRAFVGSLFDRLILSQTSRESIRHVCKVVNEQDLWPLHVARVVAECAGLVARRNKRFQLTRAGGELLPDDHAGALFRRLFLAYFRRFNLQYDFNLRDVPLIQSQHGGHPVAARQRGAGLDAGARPGPASPHAPGVRPIARRHEVVVRQGGVDSRRLRAQAIARPWPARTEEPK
jgi:hypothetical protein